jgi:hypothetical protein
MEKYNIENFYNKFKKDNNLKKDITDYFLDTYFSKTKLNFEQNKLNLFNTYSFNYAIDYSKKDDLLNKFKYRNLGILTDILPDGKIKIINLLFLPEILRVKILSLIYSYEIELDKDVKIQDIAHKKSDPNVYKLKDGLEQFKLWINSNSDLKYSINEFEIKRIQNIKQIHFKDNILIPLINEKEIIGVEFSFIFKLSKKIINK